jgi:hypothetical protein
MWEFDEARGRRMMAEVLPDARLYLAELSRALQDAKTAATIAPPALISEVAAVVARRDREMAQQLVKEAAEQSESVMRSKQTLSEISQAEARTMFAYNLVESDPKFAAEMGAAAVENRVDVSFLALLVKLHEKDPVAARRLFAKALETAMRSPDWYRTVMNLGVYALPDFGTGTMRFNTGVTGSPGDPESAAILLTAVCREATRQNQTPVQRPIPVNPTDPRSWPPEIPVAIALLPHFERLMPQCANQIRMWINNLFEAVPDPALKQRMTSAMAQKTSEQLLSEASGFQDKSQQDRNYLQAMMRALEESDWDQAFRIADMFNLEKSRIANRSSVARLAALDALAKKDIEKAIGYAEHLTSADDIAQVYSRAAALLVEKKDNSGAISLIRAARNRIEKAEEPGSGDALLVLAVAMSKADSSSAFELAAAGVGQLNKRMIEVKDLPASNQARMRWVYSRRLEPTMLQLGSVDFEESLRVSKLVEDTVPSMNARLAVCRSFLERTRKKR